jgi:hypothetical protein
MNSYIEAWAKRNHISAEVLADLKACFGIYAPALRVKPEAGEGHSESFVSSLVKLEAGRIGVKLFRNNVGVLFNEDGIPVRYGLANDSARINKVIKSSDLIGWRPVLIGPEHLGHTIAQFMARETKCVDWHYSATDHEKAQLAFLELVNRDGGDACFCTGQGTL